MATVHQRLLERKKRDDRLMLIDWGEFLQKAGLQVKFHGHGGFTVKPPEYKTITEARKAIGERNVKQSLSNH